MSVNRFMCHDCIECETAIDCCLTIAEVQELQLSLHLCWLLTEVKFLHILKKLRLGNGLGLLQQALVD